MEEGSADRFLLILLVFFVVLTISCTIVMIFQCVPVAAGWNMKLKVHARCYSRDQFTALELFNSCNGPNWNLFQKIISILTVVCLYNSCQHCHGYNIRYSPHTYVLEARSQLENKGIRNGHLQPWIPVSACDYDRNNLQMGQSIHL